MLGQSSRLFLTHVDNWESGRSRLEIPMSKPLPRTPRFGTFLKRARGGRSRESVTRQLASFGVQLDQSSLSKYEDEGRVPPLAVVRALALAYDKPLMELLDMLISEQSIQAIDWRSEGARALAAHKLRAKKVSGNTPGYPQDSPFGVGQSPDPIDNEIEPGGLDERAREGKQGAAAPRREAVTAIGALAKIRERLEADTEAIDEAIDAIAHTNAARAEGRKTTSHRRHRKNRKKPPTGGAA